jgi:hypothetical protein
MTPLRGKRACGFEDRAFGPSELARAAGVIRHPSSVIESMCQLLGHRRVLFICGFGAACR